MVTKNNDFPGEKVRARHLDFVRANWDLLCFLAYKGYVEHERGMIVVHDEDFMNNPTAVLKEIRMAFLNFKLLIEKSLLGQREMSWHDYNPETTLLVGFIRSRDTGFSSYRLESPHSDNTPRAIYERKNHDDKS